MQLNKTLISNMLLYVLVFFFIFLGISKIIDGFLFLGLISIVLALLLIPIFKIPSTYKILAIIGILAIGFIAQQKKNYYFFSLYIILGLLILLLYRSMHRKDIMENKTIKRANKLKKYLKENNLYYIIERFVQKQARFEIMTNTEVSYNYLDEKQLTKLRLLLEKNDIRISDKDLLELVTSEIREVEYLRFKKTMDKSGLVTLHDYLKRFVARFDLSTVNKKYYLSALIRFLKEKDIIISDGHISKLVGESKKELDLEVFEKNLLSEDSKPLIIDQIDHMNGYQFESFLRILFERMGYKVERSKLSWDQGADLVVTKHDRRIVIQAKRLNEKVNNKAIQEVVASLKHYGASDGMVITNSFFTSSARELGRSNNIQLIDRDGLKSLIRDYF